ncbi:polysaccharide pyruvyl transferase CsaB [Paenibacillus macerans]|uniref:polysaccharide pyruvyl transferase CsaB n=1 Tax=Paenibacillus macerans TaxID=44252 RepID=UPI001B2D4A0E|nr:polysaccharide pyruvyl transferase CsaB [Paenibacillus macerans]MBS5911295.1 polysaccharide pyruvyl transferase CsaB [Paenibacillus macerans]MDU5946333.1 polysaccharide pyruvyl transferase CsaB [Paenibacillus macerans]GIP08566.1 polysaccharide pyruvyl transferase CsaB [Paenibacillus macerans]
MVAATARTIVLSGYYGFRNSGDEAVLKSILLALEEEGLTSGIDIKPVVLSNDPEWTRRTYGVEAVHRMKLSEVRKAIKSSNGLISGGGSLLQDATGVMTIPYYLGFIKLAQWMGKPTFVYAQGIGPVKRKFFRPLIAAVFRRCDYISVRDAESAALLRSMGLRGGNVEVVPDPVMGLTLPEGESRADSPVEPDSNENISVAAPGQTEGSSIDSVSPLPVVGVSVRFWNRQRTELTQLAEGLSLLCRRKSVHIRFLPFHFPGDDEASRFVMERLGNVAECGCAVSIAPETEHPQDMLREVSECSLLIGMRLHSLIYAASQNVPLLGVSYDPKIDQFLGRIGSVPVGTAEELDPRILAAEGERLLQEGDVWRKTRASQIAGLKREARVPARRIVEFLRSKG